jgi:hypothetical protein
MRAILMVAMAAAMAAQAGAAWAQERLVLAPYPGPPAWRRITDKSGPQGYIHEQIPIGQSEDGFTDILTDQAFRNLAGADPGAFLQRIMVGMPNACEGVRVNGPTLRIEDGRRVAYGQIFCGAQRGQSFGVDLFYKVIGGAEALYSVSREFRVPPSPNGGELAFPRDQAARAMALVKAQGVANDYLVHQVYLCGPHAGDARCAGH